MNTTVWVINVGRAVVIKLAPDRVQYYVKGNKRQTSETKVVDEGTLDNGNLR